MPTVQGIWEAGVRVYVAGPISNGDQFANIAAGIDAAHAIREHGHTPFVPHLTFAWHMRHPRPYADWLEYDLAWLDVCDALVRLPGESPGADQEVAAASERGIAVYFGLKRFLALGSLPLGEAKERA